MISPELSLRELFAIAKSDPGVPRVRDALSRHTVAARERTLDRFAAWVRHHHGDLAASAVSPGIVAHYLDTYRWRGARLATVRRYAAVISRAFSYGVDLELIPRNPVRVRTHRSPSIEERRQEVRKRALSDEEVERLIAAAGAPGRVSYLQLAVILGVETGLRPGALRGLLWTDIDRRRSLIVVRRETSKGGAQNAILTPRAARALDATPRTSPYVLVHHGEPLPRWRLGKPVRALFLQCRIRGSFGSFRHTFALRAANAGVRPHQLQLLLGHRSLKTTETYLQSDLADHVPDILAALECREAAGSGR